MGTSIKLLKLLQIFLTEYRNNEFEKTNIEANNFVNLLEFNHVFIKPRQRKKKRMFKYKEADDVIQNPGDNFWFKLMVQLVP